MNKPPIAAARPLALARCAASLLLAACGGMPACAGPGMSITSVSTDRAAYAPGMPVKVTVEIAADKNASPTGTVTLQARHLAQSLPGQVRASVKPGRGDRAVLELQWQPPLQDFQGYALEVSLSDASGRVLDQRGSAVDVSSTWTRFPRYGYLTEYAPSRDAKGVIRQLNDWHLNALQFYDWQWKHHWPVKGRIDQPDTRWEEISKRTVDRQVLEGLIDHGHRRGMAAMQYNLIYGAADDFARDGIDARWGLFDTPTGSHWKLDMPAGWNTSALYLFNPANPGWQRFLIDRELEVFQAFAFDGWHGDTIGIPGIKYDGAGAPVDIAATFKPFLSAAKQRLGSKYLVMNAVGTKGHLEVSTSPVDVIYMEIWPEDGVVDYRQLKDVIDQARVESGGKSLVVPTYSNMAYSAKFSDAKPGFFNEPGVLLTEATVLAAGGSRLEIGEDSLMLCHPYFPNRSLRMSESLVGRMRGYYDFLVGYQNLLRDGQENVTRRIELSGVASSDAGEVDKVWTFAKRDAGHEIVHFINLRGARHNQWQDNDATQSKPTPLGATPVRYYTAVKASKVYVASPDVDGGRPRELAATQGHDEKGEYLSFELPQLEYWSMVFMPTGEARH